MPESKPDLADLKLEPKEYFKYLKSQESHLSKHESDGQAGSSFSCTTMRLVTEQGRREMTNDEMRKSYIDIVKSKHAKGLILMLTSEGPIRVMLHCDLVPKTTENYLELCQQGFYDGLEFHRLIPGFMV